MKKDMEDTVSKYLRDSEEKLRQAAAVKSLQVKQLLSMADKIHEIQEGKPSNHSRVYIMSEEGRRRIAESQKKRWENLRNGKEINKRNAEIKRLRGEGKEAKEIAKLMNVSTVTVYKVSQTKEEKKTN